MTTTDVTNDKEEIINRFINIKNNECIVDKELFNRIKLEVQMCEAKGQKIIFIGGYNYNNIYNEI